MTETSTAKTVISAAVTLLGEIGFGPPPVKPIRSTINDVAVWPAMEATEKSATPIIGTMWDCTATKEPPSIPANSRQRGISRFTYVVFNLFNPSLIFGLKTAANATTIKPDENEIRAACAPLSN